MKKLVFLLLVFMLTSTINMFASSAQDHDGNVIEYEFTPPAGTYSADDLQSIKLVFPNATTLSGMAGDQKIYVRRKTPSGDTSYSKQISANGNVLTIDEFFPVSAAFEQGTFAYGTWELFIYGFQIYVDGQYLDTDISVKYNIVPPGFQFESAVPANGATVNRLDEIVVDFATGSVLTGSATVNVGGVEATFAPTENAGQVKATLSPAIVAEGNYSITIPAGAFTATDGTSNSEMTLNYSVVLPEMDANEITVAPANGRNVLGLNTISLTFPEAITINENVGAITLSNGAIIDNVAVNQNVVTITASAEWQLGAYALNVPAGYFVSENAKSPALNYSWNIIAASLGVEDFFIFGGEEKDVAILLNGEAEFVGFQADITLPEGLEVVGGFVLNRGTDHVFSTKAQANGAIRLLSYSLTNAKYTGNSGDALVTFRVKAADDFNGVKQIAINGITFATKEGVEFELEPQTANVEGRLHVSSITIDPAELNLETNETATVEATVLPEAAYDKTFVWSSSNAEYVTVDENGLVKAIKPTEAENPVYIIATAQDGSGVKAQIPVTVVYTHATALTIEPATVLFEVGNRQTLTAVLDKETNKSGDVIWTSSNPAVAEIVITEGVVEVVGKSIGDANIKAQIKNGEEVVLTATIPVKVDATIATSVTVEPAELTLESGQKFTFTAVVNTEATNKNVLWTSSDPAKVAINETTGEVEALALTDSPVTITATAADGGGAYGTAQVKVVQSLATGIVLNITEVELEATGDENGQVQLTATVTPPTNKKVIWKSSKEDVAQVDENGLVTAIGVGVAEITATIEGTALTATCTVTVNPSYATNVVINYEGATKFETGSEADIQLAATVAPSYVTDNTVAWTSSDNDIAQVDENGKVTIGQKTGVVTITATANGAAEGQEVKATIDFEVVHTFATTLSIDQEPFTLKANETQQLTVTLDNATNKDIVWESNDEKVAKVDENGIVTAIGVGEATITATLEGTEIKDTVVVTVEATDGDVNNDALVDVADVTATASYILGDEVDPFIVAAADINADGKINVTDIVLLVNIILTQDDNDAQQAAINRVRQNVNSNNSLSIEDFSIEEGETKQIAIRLDNVDAFTAFQADIYLPEGLEICQNGVALSDRKSNDHVIASALRNNGSVRMLSYSLSLNEYAESNGDLVYLTIKAAEGFIGDFQIEIDNITFVKADQTKCYFAPAVSNVKGTEYVGVEGVEGDEIVVKVVGNSIVAPEGAEVYDINGLRVNAENLAKGIYIVKVGDQVVKVII
ncbi:MAG: hypothetical protein E7079_01240 [Bacteroidales bacterium]|nr:hypothetical protein [Bacteroidales bacterium]